uniref:Uncharacterized protein n=1 Tax=viral metagenome TaxID=1070528 RepID=A0A6C0EGB9_9ZZZZ
MFTATKKAHAAYYKLRVEADYAWIKARDAYDEACKTRTLVDWIKARDAYNEARIAEVRAYRGPVGMVWGTKRCEAYTAVRDASYTAHYDACIAKRLTPETEERAAEEHIESSIKVLAAASHRTKTKKTGPGMKDGKRVFFVHLK